MLQFSIQEKTNHVSQLKEQLDGLKFKLEAERKKLSESELFLSKTIDYNERYKTLVEVCLMIYSNVFAFKQCRKNRLSLLLCLLIWMSKPSFVTCYASLLCFDLYFNMRSSTCFSIARRRSDGEVDIATLSNHPTSGRAFCRACEEGGPRSDHSARRS